LCHVPYSRSSLCAVQAVYVKVGERFPASAPGGSRTPNLLIRSYPALNGLLTG
jgi:hypothetical protein